MYLVALVLTFTWANPGPFMETDGHQWTVVNQTAVGQLDGFPDDGHSCQNYVPVIPTPVLNGATPIALTLTKRACVKYLKPTP